MTKLIGATIAGAIICLVSPAQAATPWTTSNVPDDQVTLRVSYADLDLHSPAGRVTLNRRIDLAVTAMCHPDNQRDDLRTTGLKRACEKDARAQLPRQVELAIGQRNPSMQLAIVQPTAR